MSSPLTFREKLWLEGHNPIVLLRGTSPKGRPFFAYVEMTRQEYASLLQNPARYQGADKHGNVILHGEGVPDETQQRFMEDHYGFDHSCVKW